MSFRKLTAFVLAVTVGATLLAGCGETKKEKPAATAAPAAGSDMVGNMFKTGLPIVKDKVTLKAIMAVQPQHGKLEDMEFFKRLEAKTNVHIEWNAIPQASYNDKKNMMLAAGEFPDIYFGTAVLQTEDVTKYAPQGIFVALDKLIDDYAPNLKAAFEKSPAFKKTCTNIGDNKIYNIGRAAERETQYGIDNMFIYKPWLDKLGLKVPETTEEFYTTLKAFKEKDPNGNGKADEIPYSFVFKNGSVPDLTNDFHSLFGAFGRVDSSYNHLINDNGKMVFTADKPEYKEAIKYFNRMFKEGLFDKEGFTAKDTKGYIAKGNSADVILGSSICFDPSIIVKADRVKDYVPMAPLKGPAGKQIWAKSGHSNGNISPMGFTISKNNKYPEASVRWIDQFFDKQTSVESFLGPVDVNIKKGANGMFEYIDTPQGMTYTEFRLKNAPVHAPAAIFADEWNKVVKVMDEDKSKMEIINKYYKPYWTNSTIYFRFNDEESKFMLSSGKDLQEYAEQMYTKWLLDGGIDQDWDAYLAKLKQLKLDEYIKVNEAAFTRWNTK